jgi:serine phosphatase RsbU (regulator of sigma subunit)
MTTNLMRAAQFLNDINQITYMNIVSSLYTMQLGLLKNQKGQKEVHFIS